MNVFYRNKIVNIILLVTMLSHITFMHSIVNEYVVCYGSDGHVEIENVNDSANCENHSIFEAEGITTSYFSSLDCEDISLEKNCFEEEQFISKNRINIYAGIQKNNVFIFLTENHKKTCNKIETNTFGNNILESYTTVSLII